MEELSILNMQLEAISPFIRRGGTGVALWNSSFTRGGSFVSGPCPGVDDGGGVARDVLSFCTPAYRFQRARHTAPAFNCTRGVGCIQIEVMSN